MWTYEQVEYALTVAGEAWLASASEQPRQMHALWEARPFAPSTLPCGRVFDVVAFPDEFGRQVLDELWATGPGAGPVTTYGGTVQVFCTPGTADELRQLLAWQEWDHLPPVRCYGTGDSVTLPPFRRHQDDDTPDRWIQAPEDGHPWLPSATALLHACLRAARTIPRPPTRTPMTTSTDTDTMTTDPLTALRTLAEAHLRDLTEQRRVAAEAARVREAQRLRGQAATSAKDAAACVRERLNATLHLVLAPEDWTGYPSQPATDSHTAVAFLAEGIWALYYQSTAPHLTNRGLYLLVRCPCAKYIEVEVDSDELLADALQTISRWQADPIACTRACEPATWPTPWTAEDDTPPW